MRPYSALQGGTAAGTLDKAFIKDRQPAEESVGSALDDSIDPVQAAMVMGLLPLAKQSPDFSQVGYFAIIAGPSSLPKSGLKMGPEHFPKHTLKVLLLVLEVPLAAIWRNPAIDLGNLPTEVKQRGSSAGHGTMHFAPPPLETKLGSFDSPHS